MSHLPGLAACPTLPLRWRRPRKTLRTGGADDSQRCDVPVLSQPHARARLAKNGSRVMAKSETLPGSACQNRT